MRLIKCVEKVTCAPDVEQPDQRNSPGRPTSQREDSRYRKEGRDEITIRRGSREGLRQRRGNDSRDKKAQTDESECVRHQKGCQCTLPAQGPDSGPDVKGREQAEGDEVHQDAEPE